MKKFIKIILILALSSVVLFIGLYLMLALPYANAYSDITEEDCIKNTEVNTGLYIGECEFIKRDVSGGPWGDHSSYEIKFDDDTILSQIQNDTSWVKVSTKNHYVYTGEPNSSLTVFLDVRYDADKRILYFEEDWSHFE